jgi:integrase/recombinase XerD
MASGVGLASATLQQRLMAVRLFYDHLIEEGRRETNPVATWGPPLSASRGPVAHALVRC